MRILFGLFTGEFKVDNGPLSGLVKKVYLIYMQECVVSFC